MPRIFDGSPELRHFSHAAAVTPNDSADLTVGQALSLYIGVSGDVALDTPTATNVLFKAVPVGVLNVAATRVRATGTTATSIVALR